MKHVKSTTLVFCALMILVEVPSVKAAPTDLESIAADYLVYSNSTNNGAGINRKMAYAELVEQCSQGDILETEWVGKTENYGTEYGYYAGICSERNLSNPFKIIEVFSNDTNDYSGGNLAMAQKELRDECGHGKLVSQDWITTKVLLGSNYGYLFGRCKVPRK